MNPIQYLKMHGFKVTSDPSNFQPWGLRNYTVNGYNYDSYCNGYHRAYDLSKYHLAPIPAVFNGVVVSGTTNYGNFGATVVVANETLGYQVIYGHLARPIPVKIGQKVSLGQTIGRQSNTNYHNVYMASHLHIQFQKYGYLSGHHFVCHGVIQDYIDVYMERFNVTGKFKLNGNIRLRKLPSINSKVLRLIRRGEVVQFKKLIRTKSYWWIETRDGFMAIAQRTKLNFYEERMFWGRLFT